jgi:quercetin dioxygenase-like cupin family protein
MVNVLNTKVEPISEHDGTVTSYFMYEKERLREATMGSYLEFINEFALTPHVAIQPHYHNTHEFYYIIKGSGLMNVDNATKEMTVGDMVHIPPNAIHSILAGPEGVRCFCFAVSFQAPGETYTVATLDNWPPKQ